MPLEEPAAVRVAAEQDEEPTMRNLNPCRQSRGLPLFQGGGLSGVILLAAMVFMTSPFASGAPQSKGPDTSPENTLAAPDSEAQGETKRTFSPAQIREISKRFQEAGRHVFLLGANGELIAVRHAGVSDSALLLIPRDNGLDLIVDGPISEFSLDSMDTYLSVDERGRIDYGFPLKSSRHSKMAPEFWPYVEKSGELKMPAINSVLWNRGAEKALESNICSPHNATGWLLLTWDDYLVAPLADAERPPNVLWIVPGQEGVENGFQLIHSGPLRSGVFMTVTEERKVIPGDAASDRMRSANSDLCWPYTDAFGADDGLSMLPEGEYGPAYCDCTRDWYVLPEGKVMPAPVRPLRVY